MIGRIYIGFDPKEQTAYRVAEHSIRKHATIPLDIQPLHLDRLRAAQLIWRRMEVRDGVLWDLLSKAPCSTQFAISRFLVPLIALSGWALFLDPDILVTRDIGELFALLDDRYAAMCVKRAPQEDGVSMKMDSQPQSHYPRKNWSSVCAYNASHPQNRALTLGIINNFPGRDLHALRWLTDDAIGSLPPTWNHLVGIDTAPELPAICHFTLGSPDVPGYEDSAYADLWRAALAEIG